MASSNRHWPSMFKSKPINHHSSLLSNSCARSSDNSPFSSGGEERSTPEPKPRWNPKPEQIRILEAIFNSGMVNPPRDEIRRIRTQLQEYGQVGDANVFYWFQNRKSRSKNKQRSLQPKTATTTVTATTTTSVITATSSSSSSSDKNSPNNNKNNINNNIVCGGEQFVNSPTSVNQCNNNNYFQQLISPNNHNHNQEFVSHEPVFFPLHQSGVSVLGNNFSQGLYFSQNHSNIDININNNNNNNMMNGGDHVHVTLPCDQTVGGFSSLLLGDMFSGRGVRGGCGGGGGELKGDEVEKLKFQQELSFLVSTQDNNNNNNNINNDNNTCTIPSSSHVVSTPISTAISSNLGQMLGETGEITGKITVFINGMAIEVPNGGFNVKEEFGEDVMLVHATTGHPVVTNEWGVTVHGLQQDLVEDQFSYSKLSSDQMSPRSTLLKRHF
ncbi:hypothetical protein RND81_06G110300 [Saponaria officinalis]|uniref:Homeobox domain-containing protein n=1 Tax=Saponaria officinalis TaxID=3572 RepID=A0AAW1K5L7_SAPOF